MKKLSVIVLILGVLVVGGYLFLRHALGTTTVKPVAKKPAPESAVDLEPLFIAKLQQMVKDGSNGLYSLSVNDLSVDILASNVVLLKPKLTPDFSILKKLDSLQKAPDDVFTISLDSLRIDGLGLADVISGRKIDLKDIRIKNPVIEVYHKKRSYNAKKPADTTTIYQRIKNEIDRISLKSIAIENGVVTNYNVSKKNKKTALQGVMIQLNDLLLDSATQWDKNRFLFAKEANISFRDYRTTSENGLYQMKLGGVSVQTNKRLMTVKDFSVFPLYSRAEFRKKVKFMTEQYKLQISSLTFKDIDWWQVINEENFKASEAAINGAYAEIYLDRSMPSSGSTKKAQYPHQMLMSIPVPITVPKVTVQQLEVLYEELNPTTGKSGKLYVSNIHGTISNVTNDLSLIKKQKWAKVDLDALFLKKVPISALFNFDLSQAKKGTFSVHTELGSADAELINPIAEPIGLFSVKTGSVKKAVATLSGNNQSGKGKLLFLYDDLHLTVLKKDPDGSGLKKKTFTTLLANTVLIKNDNPSGNNEPRTADIDAQKNPSGTFFNLIWKSILQGMLKTIGINPKLVKE